jgi:hypothetical protein
MKKKILYVHRLAYELANGRIPDDLKVCHRCDNPACVRPDHLFLGTQKDNMQDASTKGRIKTLRGDDHPWSKLTSAEVSEIRRAAANGEKQKMLAERFHVTTRAINAIINERAWKRETGDTGTRPVVPTGKGPFNSDRLALPLFPSTSTSPPNNAKALWFSEIDHARAKEMNRLWHSSLPDTGGGPARVCYVAECGGLFYAVGIWKVPSSPRLPQTAWLQLSRLAVAGDAPKNTASRFLGWRMRQVAQRYPEVETLVSYQDCIRHTGGIYAACGWEPGPIEIRRPATTWHNRKRAKFVSGKPLTVRRWTKTLFPRRA